MVKKIRKVHHVLKQNAGQFGRSLGFAFLQLSLQLLQNVWSGNPEPSTIFLETRPKCHRAAIFKYSFCYIVQKDSHFPVLYGIWHLAVTLYYMEICHLQVIFNKSKIQAHCCEPWNQDSTLHVICERILQDSGRTPWNCKTMPLSLFILACDSVFIFEAVPTLFSRKGSDSWTSMCLRCKRTYFDSDRSCMYGDDACKRKQIEWSNVLVFSARTSREKTYISWTQAFMLFMNCTRHFFWIQRRP